MKKRIILIGVILSISGIVFGLLFSKDDANEKMLTEIAKDTYNFFEKYTNENTGLTIDRVDLGEQVKTYDQTSPTNIAMYLTSMVSAVEFGFIGKDEARDKVQTTLHTLSHMETWNGLYYNWYYTDDGSLMTDWGQFISTVDNGWLTAALVIVGEYFSDLKSITDPLIEQMDYSSLYDFSVGQFRGGFDLTENKLTDHHYGLLYSETRITSYVAIGKGDVPSEHWWQLDRTLPKEYGQSQIPQGEYKTYDGMNVFEGYYTYGDLKFVPSWGGSMFEALMPALFVHEKKLGRKGLGLNNLRHVEGQIKFAEEKGYDVWGFSPAGIVNGYSEFGAPVLGTKGYEDQATVTPHATFLALEYKPEASLENIEKLKQLGLYGEFGFYDSIDLRKSEIARSYLSLDQGMILTSLANYLKDDVLRNSYHRSSIGKMIESLIEKEEFMIQ